MKKIDVKSIEEAVSEMCIEANTVLSDDILKEMEIALAREESPNAISILETMIKNFEIAEKKDLPICQDTGMVVVFVTFGQDVQIVGGALETAIQKGVQRGYEKGYLRKSIVKDPFIRNNTKTNTPAVIHYKIVPGDALHIRISPKGFGSENASALKMLKPSQGLKGVEAFVIETVEKGAPNACAPLIVGVGIGGTFEKAAILAKEALNRPLGERNQQQHLQGLEEILIERCNNLGFGPMGLGGINTILGVHVEVFPTHQAGLPVAVNIGCYVNRHAERTL